MKYRNIKNISLIGILFCVLACGFVIILGNEKPNSQNEKSYEYIFSYMVDTSTEENIYNSLNKLFVESHQEIAVLLSSEVLRYHVGEKDVIF